MNARPLLERIARAIETVRLEAVLVGNAGAALPRAPVTTVDFDFMFRKTPGNLRKLRRLARELDAVILTPFYPASELFRVVNDDTGLQVDFMPRLDGIRSFEALLARAVAVRIGDASLLMAQPSATSCAASEPRIARATGPRCRCWRRPSVSKRARSRRARARGSALRAESERALREQIRRLLARPMAERTHFLRVRLPGGGSAL